MDEERVSRRYCVIIQLAKSSNLERLAEAVPWLKAMVERWSKGEMEQLCRSNDGQLFGYLFRTTKPEQMLVSEFEKSPGTTNNDSLIVFEVGEKSSGTGFSRAAAWLQHH